MTRRRKYVGSFDRKEGRRLLNLAIFDESWKLRLRRTTYDAWTRVKERFFGREAAGGEAMGNDEFAMILLNNFEERMKEHSNHLSLRPIEEQNMSTSDEKALGTVKSFEEKKEEDLDTVLCLETTQEHERNSSDINMPMSLCPKPSVERPPEIKEESAVGNYRLASEIPAVTCTQQTKPSNFQWKNTITTIGSDGKKVTVQQAFIQKKKRGRPPKNRPVELDLKPVTKTIARNDLPVLQRSLPPGYRVYQVETDSAGNKVLSGSNALMGLVPPGKVLTPNGKCEVEEATTKNESMRTHSNSVFNMSMPNILSAGTCINNESVDRWVNMSPAVQSARLAFSRALQNSLNQNKDVPKVENDEIVQIHPQSISSPLSPALTPTSSHHSGITGQTVLAEAVAAKSRDSSQTISTNQSYSLANLMPIKDVARAFALNLDEAVKESASEGGIAAQKETTEGLEVISCQEEDLMDHGADNEEFVSVVQSSHDDNYLAYEEMGEQEDYVVDEDSDAEDPLNDKEGETSDSFQSRETIDGDLQSDERCQEPIERRTECQLDSHPFSIDSNTTFKNSQQRGLLVKENKESFFDSDLVSTDSTSTFQESQQRVLSDLAKVKKESSVDCEKFCTDLNGTFQGNQQRVLLDLAKVKRESSIDSVQFSTDSISTVHDSQHSVLLDLAAVKKESVSDSVQFSTDPKSASQSSLQSLPTSQLGVPLFRSEASKVLEKRRSRLDLIAGGLLKKMKKDVGEDT